MPVAAQKVPIQIGWTRVSLSGYQAVVTVESWTFYICLMANSWELVAMCKQDSLQMKLLLLFDFHSSPISYSLFSSHHALSFVWVVQMFAVLWSTLLVIIREAGRTNLLDIPFHPPVWSSAFALNLCYSYPGMQNYMFRAGCRTSNEPPLLTLEVRTSSAEQLTRVVMLSLSPILVHGVL